MRHLLDLIGTCEVLSLRQLALGGISFTAQCMTEYGMPNDAVSEAMAAWVTEDGGAKVLLRHIVSDHTQLDLKEDAAVSPSCLTLDADFATMILKLCDLPFHWIQRSPVDLHYDAVSYNNAGQARPFYAEIKQDI